ncbi:MAG TPA: hypothetical protein VGS61_05680, partial [Acidimicrobiales bacterium]|nr:hypothetical protein [Acidimicrobiales bacterium]
LSEASTHSTGDVDDSLAMIVNGDPTDTEAPAVVWTVGSVAANGHLAAAIGAGVEIATFAEAATGRHPVFVVHQTGTFGGVSWVTGFESLAAYDADVTKLFADPGWFPLIDRQSEHFSTDPSFLESALWVKLS